MTTIRRQARSSADGTLRASASRTAGLLGYFLETSILRRKIPLIASFKLTYRCNLACLGCPFHLRAGEPGSHMTWPVALESLARLRRIGVRIVVFEGGEPLLWSDGGHGFTDLARHARSMFSCIGATTNGTLPLDVPTDILWVSVDGSRSTHDALRSASYDTLMARIRECRHPKLFVHYTMNRRNRHDFPDSARTLLSMEAVRGITVQFFYPYQLGEEDLRLTPSERRDAADMVLGLKRSGLRIMNSTWGLNAIASGSWTCREWILANVDPDGAISTGCYARNRGGSKCDECGFTPVAEASGAVGLRPGALRSGFEIFIR
jgi:MoaA/NifB/PqqE/SkfB family radical SAM enzyme